MRSAVVIVLTAMLAGCAGSGEVGPPGGAGQAVEGVTGNERGGKISYQDGGQPAAMNAATAHCRNYGKKAQITKMTPASSGMDLTFECN
jgi:hypothetical protein